MNELAEKDIRRISVNEENKVFRVDATENTGIMYLENRIRKYKKYQSDCFKEMRNGHADKTSEELSLR